MQLLIAADMEGVSGVVHWDHVDPTQADYSRFRRLMTGDVNAAIRGAFDGGATDVVVADGHNLGRNILIEDLDSRARLNSGSPSPLSMVQGITPSIEAALFVGYHARAGTQNAILDHSWSSSTVSGVWLNGRAVGEIALNAAVCGHWGVPLIFISGDQSACAEACDLVPGIEVAVVKQASGRMAAECLHPEAAQLRIYEGAKRAVAKLAAGLSPAPLRFGHPLALAVDLIQSDMADRAAGLPGSLRTSARRIEVTAEDPPSAYRAFRALVALARA